MKSASGSTLRITGTGLALLAAVAGIDYFIPVNVQFVLLYLLPLGYIAVNVPIRYGTIACLWAALCWGASNYFANGEEIINGVRMWNMSSRFIIFFTFVSLIHYFKIQLLEKESAMAALRKSKVESNTIMGLRRICRECEKVQSDKDEWLPIKTWLSRDAKVTWADSCCPSCRKSEIG